MLISKHAILNDIPNGMNILLKKYFSNYNKANIFSQILIESKLKNVTNFGKMCLSTQIMNEVSPITFHIIASFNAYSQQF